MLAKKRKPTNQVRREEAEALRKELQVLQDELQQLQARAELAAMTPDDHLLLLERSLRTQSLLQNLLQDQHLVVAGAQSELLNFQHSSEQRYDDPQGNFCCDRFEVTHLAGVKSLREVYKAAKFFLTNVEISTTEALGHLTVRENYDTICEDESINSFRLISARPSGIVTESSKVLYDKYYEHHELTGNRPCAVMVTDSVDVDELHPYDSKSRVRLDVSAVLFLSEVRQTPEKNKITT
ncbi:unnamed protein product [Phytophthora fragariaefolia]|uniref:Unnamed protein product n=1 Tax=Phytophthora fragariaefolia TaxID=1490495 RepID=A0A9W6XK42_9STRA|nr:unnamed protein product [Phytophthora fragariaefolia]